MKVLSFNYRGLASPDKKLAFQRLIMADPVDVILVQETLGNAKAISSFLVLMLPGWSFQALDASKSSGGMALGFNTQTINLINCWGGPANLGADIFLAELGTEIMLINVYAPCHHRTEFWENLLSYEIFRKDLLILGGDLNFSLGHSES